MGKVLTLALRLDSKGLVDPAKHGEAALRGVGDAAIVVEGKLSKTSTAAALAGRAMSALAATLGVREWARVSDAYASADSRLKLVTRSSQDLATVQARLAQIADDTFSSYTATADLYTRFARSSNVIGASQSQLLAVTKAVNQSFLITGESALSAQSAMIQLGQGFQSGTLRGEELNSVLEQAPRLAQAIAEGLGITQGELRKLAAAGELGPKRVFDAIFSQIGKVDAEAQKMAKTIGQSIQTSTNVLSRQVVAFNELTGAAHLAGAGIEALAENSALLAAIFGARFAGRAVESLTQSAKAATLARAETAAYATETERAAAASNLAAQAELKIVTAREAEIAATQLAIAEERALQAARLAAGNATVQRATTQLAQPGFSALGGAVSARTQQQLAAGNREVSESLKELGRLGQAQAAINMAQVGPATALAAANARVSVTATASRTAQIALAEATNLTTLAMGRAATTGRLLWGAIGGAPGAIIIAAAAAWQLYASGVESARAELEKFNEEFGKTIANATRDQLQAKRRQLDADIADAQSRRDASGHGDIDSKVDGGKSFRDRKQAEEDLTKALSARAAVLLRLIELDQASGVAASTASTQIQDAINQTAESLREELVGLRQGEDALSRYKIAKIAAGKTPPLTTPQELSDLNEQVITLRRGAAAIAELNAEFERRLASIGPDVDTMNSFLGDAQQRLAPTDADIRNWLLARQAAKWVGAGIREVDEAMLALSQKKGIEKMKEALDDAGASAKTTLLTLEGELGDWLAETNLAEALKANLVEAALSFEDAMAHAFTNIVQRGKGSVSDLVQFSAKAWEIIATKRAADDKAQGGSGTIGNVAKFGIPALGAAATIAETILGSAARAREAERQMDAALRDFGNSVAEEAERLKNTGNTFAQAIADIRSNFERDFLEIANALTSTLAKGALQRNNGNTDAAIAELDALASAGGKVGEKAREGADQLRRLSTAIEDRKKLDDDRRYEETRSQAERQARLSQDASVRILIAQGRGEEAAATELANRHAWELADAITKGLDPALLLLAQDAERTALGVAQAAEEARKAAEEARTLDNLRLEALRLQGDDSGARELERQIRLGAATSNAQKELIELIFALEDTARAAAEAAAEQAALLELMRGIEDLDVRDLRSQGHNDEADFRQFMHQQEREYADAVARAESADSAGGKTVTEAEQAYLDHLKNTLENELAKWLADHAPETPAGLGAGGAFTGASPVEARSSVNGQSIATATVVQTDRVISELTTIRIRMGRLISIQEAMLRGGVVLESNIGNQAAWEKHQSGDVVIT